MWIEENDGVTIRDVRGVGSDEGWVPSILPMAKAGSLDLDVVGSSLAGAVEPDREEVAVGALDDGTAVDVLGLEREDEAVFGLGLGGTKLKEADGEAGEDECPVFHLGIVCWGFGSRRQPFWKRSLQTISRASRTIFPDILELP